MSGEPVRVKWTLSIGFVNAVHSGEFTIDREEWNGLTPQERGDLLDDYYDVEVSNHLDGGWDVQNADVNDPTA